MAFSKTWRSIQFNGRDMFHFTLPPMFKINRLPHWTRYIPDDVNVMIFIDFDNHPDIFQNVEFSRTFPTEFFFILITSKYLMWLESIHSPSEHFGNIIFRCDNETARQILRLMQMGRLTVIGIPESTNRYAVSVPIVIEITKIIGLNFQIQVLCKQNEIYAAKNYFSRVFKKYIDAFEDVPTFRNVNAGGYSNGRTTPSASNVSFGVSLSRHVTVDHHTNNDSAGSFEIEDFSNIIDLSYYDDCFPKDTLFEVKSRDEIFSRAAE